jgi:arsenate reductase-like glutaredoxin family protein
MSLQIIGSKKCRSTQKLERLLKERKVKYQFVSLEERNLSTGEWNHIFQFYTAEELIDKNSPLFKKKNLAFLDYNGREELEENNLLLKTPLVRLARKVYLDPSQESLLALLKNSP